MQYMALGMKRDKALQITGLTHHKFYHRKSPGKKRGARPSVSTQHYVDGKWQEAANEEVVEKIKENHRDPDLSYGYRKMSSALQLDGYDINHKKVYRLMRESQLLQLMNKSRKKNYAKYRVIIPEGPLQCLEMDIKYVWIESQRRHGYILTILDVFTRMVLEWHVGLSITQHTVKQVFARVIVNHLQTHDMLSKGIDIEVRNDNDKRFSAQMVQQFFEDNFLNQVFTHPYTPQENGHVESFHAILGRSLDRCHFETLDDLEQHLTLFYHKYNNERVHGSIANLPPSLFWEEWLKGNIKREVMHNNKVRFKSKIPRYQLSGNDHLRESSCLPVKGNKKVNGAITLIQPSVQRSPSVASC